MLSPVSQRCWCQTEEALLLEFSSPPFPPWQEQRWQPGDEGSKQREAYEEETLQVSDWGVDTIMYISKFYTIN